MGDIQALRKPSNIPPVTLEELNDYSEGNKDKWINNHKIGTAITHARYFIPDHIYYLATNLINYTGREEMIGYIKGGLVFLPFYKRNIVTKVKTPGKWEDYTTNFEMGGQTKYAFIFDLGPNERAESEARRSREDDERARRRAEEDASRDEAMVEEAKARSLQLMEQMNLQREAEERSREQKRQEAAARLREAETKGESTGLEGVQLTDKNTGERGDIGGRRTRRKLKQSRRSRKLKQSRSSRKLRNKKSKKSKKYRRK
jgi:hypothetical protein